MNVIKVEYKTRANGSVRMRASMGDRYSYTAYDYEVEADANARHAFRRFRRELIAKGFQIEPLVWDCGRLDAGCWVFVTRTYPDGEEV